MNKTIIINISSIVFHIEEEAYEILRKYIADIKKFFSHTPDSDEILQDIENRIAEMFSERIQIGKKEVITSLDVQEVMTQMGKVSDFEELEGDQGNPSTEEASGEKNTSFKAKKLMRNPDEKVIGGVCSGLGYYFGIETVWVRVLFVLVFLFMGSGILIYIVLWIIMPQASSRADRMAMRGEEPNLQNMMKNFQEEFKGYNDGFNKVTGQISKEAKNIGPMISSFFNFLGKALVSIMLFICGMIIIGLLISFVGFATGILGYQNEMVFPGLGVFSIGQALLALLAGTLAITIPFITLFYILLRLLLKIGPMNNYLSLSLWAAWITSIILVLFYSITGIQEFKETSTISIEKQIQKQDVYYFVEKDLRIINASAESNDNKRITIDVNGTNLSAQLNRDINIQFEYLDSLETPFIQYKYSAKGRSRKDATERASNIQYLAKQEHDKIIFDSHFFLPKAELFRNQSVQATIFLPLGSKVIIQEPIHRKMWSIPYKACKKEYKDEERSKETEWIMKRSGLVCSPYYKEITNEISM